MRWFGRGKASWLPFAGGSARANRRNMRLLASGWSAISKDGPEERAEAGADCHLPGTNLLSAYASAVAEVNGLKWPLALERALSNKVR